jgi:predicted hydrocarbon binding protein
MPNSISNRQTLGGFSSVVCFKAVITGMEEALGEKATAIALIAAGRTRGKNVAQSLGLSNSTADFTSIATQLNQAVGLEGTRLTAIEKIEQVGDVIKVYCSETVCSAGEPQGSDRKCTFTLGAVWGAMTEITGKKLRGTHTESVLRGGNNDVFEFTIVE